VNFIDLGNDKFLNPQVIFGIDLIGNEKSGFRWRFKFIDAWINPEVSKSFSTIEEAREWLSIALAPGVMQTPNNQNRQLIAKETPTETIVPVLQPQPNLEPFATSPEPLIVFVDGSVGIGDTGNPGWAGVGIVFKKGGQVIERISEPIGVHTSAEAEYIALIIALEKALEKNEKIVKVFSDADFVVNQVNSLQKSKRAKYRKLQNRAIDLSLQFSHFTLSHIKRKQNVMANDLARLACEKSASENSNSLNKISIISST